MSMVEFAREELERIGGKDDEMQQMMNENILELMQTLSKQGHSGFSANYAINAFRRLAQHKPLKPLTGDEEEWCDTFSSNDTMQQNKRCPSVFRINYDNETAYNSEGKIFSNDGGQTWYTNYESHVPIGFPYHVPDSPKKFLVDEETGKLIKYEV